MTAHCIGGCVMGTDPAHGVIDAQHRVFGYHGLYIVDGSAVGANLGVNPSLTITALAERAMSFIPDRRSADTISAAGEQRGLAPAPSSAQRTQDS